MHVLDAGPPGRAAADDTYAPFPVVSDARRWGLTETVVPAGGGPVVVHHRPGPAPLLMLHGVAGSWTTWTPLLHAARGAGGRGLVLVDLPGWGASPAPSTPLDVDGAVGVVVAVLDALGIGAVDVVGHSMGAFVGLHLAATRPDRVRSLGLVSGTTVATADAARRPLRALRTLPAFTLLRAGLAVTGDAGRTVLRTLARVGLLPLLAAPVFTHVRRLDRSVLDAFVDELRPRAFTAVARAAAAYDVERWRGIACPVTAIAGRGDVFARVRDLDDLGRLVPGVRTVLLDDCGHFAHVERPTVVAGVLGLAAAASARWTAGHRPAAVRRPGR